MISCKTCSWAVWEETTKGRINKVLPGTCNYPIVYLPNIPISTATTIEAIQLSITRRYSIWPDDGVLCLCHKQK